MNRTERTDLYIHIYVVSEAYNSNIIHVAKSVSLCLCVCIRYIVIYIRMWEEYDEWRISSSLDPPPTPL